jgi:hypothetical protein
MYALLSVVGSIGLRRGGRRRSGGNDRISLLGGLLDCRRARFGAASHFVVRYGEI